MKGRMVLTIGVALVISLGIPLLAFQGSDSLTGPWKGDWGPSASDRNRDRESRPGCNTSRESLV